MKNIAKYIGGPLGVSVIFLVAATLHRMGIEDTATYVNSPLIAIEFATLILLMVSVPVLLILAIVMVVKRGWKVGLLMLLNVLIVIFAIIAGLAIDSPTLIYMT